MKRVRRSLYFFAALTFVVQATAATCPQMRSFRNAALVVGISNPSLQEGPPGLRFAGADADRLQSLFEKQFGQENVFKLKDAAATATNLSNCLDGLVHWAQNGSKVVIFISARGFSSSELDDGYVLTSDATIDKLPRVWSKQNSNGISMQLLRSKMDQMPAKEKYLFLDMYRDPAETPGFNNLINNRVQRFLDTDTHQIVLASSGSRRSLEAPELRFGFYADGLSETLKPGFSLQDLFDVLKTKVKEKSQSKQTPNRPSSNDGWRDRLFGGLTHIQGPLLASLFQGGFVANAIPAEPSPSEVRDLNEAISNEEDAQRIFARYGEGNHFPGDPFQQCENANTEFRKFQLCREEYETAARQFERAAELRRSLPPTDPNGNQSVIASLLERAHFCRAQTDLLTNSAARVESELGQPAKFQFAESHNILGIAYLELGDYPKAEAQFELAIHKAPHWAYPRHNLALAYVEHGNYSAAEKQYREAIHWTPVGDRFADKENPCFHGRKVMVSARPYLYYNLGVLFQRVNRLAEAQQAYCMAEISFRYRMDQLDSPAPEEDVNAAMLASLRSQAARFNLADVNNSLGVLFESRNKERLATAQFNEALKNNKDLSAARFNLARLDAAKALARRDTSAARQSYQAVLDQPFCQGSGRDFGCQAAQTALDRLPAVGAK